MSVDADGLLQVTAIDHCSGDQQSINIKIEKQGNLKPAQIQQMKNDAALFAEQDRNFNAGVAAKNGFEQFIWKMETIKKDANAWRKLSAIDQATVDALIDEAKEWLNNNTNASSKDFEKKTDELNGMFKPLEAKTIDLTPLEVEDEDGMW